RAPEDEGSREVLDGKSERRRVGSPGPRRDRRTARHSRDLVGTHRFTLSPADLVSCETHSHRAVRIVAGTLAWGCEESHTGVGWGRTTVGEAVFQAPWS